jgi:hypothetical protein
MEVFDLTAQILVSMGNTEQQLTAAQRHVKDLEARLLALEVQHKKNTHTATEHAGVLQHVLGHSIQDVTSKVQGLTRETGVLGSTISVASGQLSGLSGSAGLVVGTFAALVGTTVAAGAVIFELTEKTSEYGNSIYKASQKTGLSTTTLQALKIAGHEVGMELEAMSTGLVRFTNNLNAAGTGNKKMADFFRVEGVTAFRNSDQALIQFMTHFASLPTGQDRVLAASKAFGARFGASLIETFNQVGGNLDSFIKKLEEEGVLMSGDAITASHEYTVALHELENKFGALTREVGLEFYPIVRKAMDWLSGWLSENRGQVKQWAHDWADSALDAGKAFGEFAASMARDAGSIGRDLQKIGHDLSEIFHLAQGMGKSIYGAVTLDPKYAGQGGSEMVDAWNSPTAAERAAQKARNDDLVSFIKNADPRGERKKAEWYKSKDRPDATLLGGGGGGGKKGSDPAAEEKRLREIELKEILDGFKEQADAQKRSLSNRWISLQDFTQNSITIEGQRHAAVLQGLGLETDAAVRLKKGSSVALAQIDLKRHEEQRKFAEETSKLFDAFNKDEIDKTRAREEAILAIKDTSAKTEKDRWQHLADARVITTEQAVEEIGAVEMAGLARRLDFQRAELARAMNDTKLQQAARLEMGKIEAEMGALAIRTEYEADQALKKRLATQRDFNEALLQANAAMRVQLLDLAKQRIAHQIQIVGPGQNDQNIWRANRATDRIDTQQENVSNELAKRQLFLKLLRDMDQKSFDERRKLYEQFVLDRDALEKKHEQVLQDVLDRSVIETRQKVVALSQSLTSIIDRSLTTGFQSGMKAGLLEFVKGILDIIRGQALKNLETAIADAIMKGIQGGASAGSGGGGIWNMLFGILMGGLSGGLGFGAGKLNLGGGSSYTPGGTGLVRPRVVGSRAAGGPAFAGMPLLVGDRADRKPEVFVPGSNGHIFTQDQMRAMIGSQNAAPQIHNYYSTWNVQTPNPASFMGRDTQAQITRHANRAINVSKVRAGG